MKAILLPGFILMAFLFFISCNKNQSTDFKEGVSPATDNMESKEKTTLNGEQVSKIMQTGNLDSLPPLPTPSPTQPDWDKKIIKEGSLRLAIEDFSKFNAEVHDKIRKAGGYVEQEELNFVSNSSEMTVTIKVPVMQFESLLNELAGMAKEVKERKISTDNVTSEFVDIRARLEARKQMRLKYLEFLDKAKNMQEVLQVQTEINNIQEHIEAATQRSNFLTSQSAMSTIHLAFYPFVGDKGISSPSYVTRFIHAFRQGGKWLAEVLIGLASIWPMLLIIFTVIIGWRNRKYLKGLVGSTASR